MTVLDMLLATDSLTVNGVLYYDLDMLLSRSANEVYSAINEQGAI